MLLKTLKELPDNKRLPYTNFLDNIYLYFVSTLGKNDFQEVKKYVKELLNVLKNKEYVNVIKDGLTERDYIITKGLDFDEWEKQYSSNQVSNTQIINNIGTMTNSNLQQATSLSNQSISYQDVNKNNIQNNLDAIKKELLKDSTLSEEEKNDVTCEVSTIEAQLKSNRTNKNIIQASYNTLLDITKGATGSALWDAIKILGTTILAVG
jgi:hypothetical protein